MYVRLAVPRRPLEINPPSRKEFLEQMSQYDRRFKKAPMLAVCHPGDLSGLRTLTKGAIATAILLIAAAIGTTPADCQAGACCAMEPSTAVATIPTGWVLSGVSREDCPKTDAGNTFWCDAYCGKRGGYQTDWFCVSNQRLRSWWNIVR
jgi:hypothetical protein